MGEICINSGSNQEFYECVRCGKPFTKEYLLYHRKKFNEHVFYGRCSKYLGGCGRRSLFTDGKEGDLTA